MKKNKKLQIFFMHLNFLIGLALFGFGIFLVCIGFHSFDLGMNINQLNCELNITLMDKASDFNLYTGDELYIHGINYLFIGMCLLTWGSFVLGGYCVLLGCKKH